MFVEFSWRLLFFFVVVGLLQTALDVIVLSAWRSFVRKRGWKPLWYIIPIALGVMMFFVFPFTVYLRQVEWYPSQLNKFLHKALAYWYLPKIAVVVFLSGRVLVRWLQGHLNVWIVNAIIYAAEHTPKALETTKIVVLQRLQSALLHAHFLRSFALRLSDMLSSVLLRFVPKETQTHQSTDISAISPEISLSRRIFLTKAVNAGGYALAAVPVVALGGEALFTLYDFEVHRVDIPIKNLPRQFEGLTIAQLSDIHAGSFFSEKPMEEVCRIVESLKPDMVLVTGDWVNWRAVELPMILPQIVRLANFATKQTRLGLWGSLGNHDHYSSGAAHTEILSLIRSAGVNLMVNENTTFSIDGARLQMAAIDNVGLRQNFGNLDEALAGLSPEHPTILMAHDPTFWDKKIHAKPHETAHGNILVDLTLSGHTHGGQMGLSVFGMDITPAALMYKQVAGLYADDYELGQHIYVNRGIGTTGIPVRLGVPPEVTLITLRRA
jgi:hypothetical protein